MVAARWPPRSEPANSHVDVDPQAWLADVLARIAGHPAHQIDDLLPWNWRVRNGAVSQAA